VAVLAVLDGQPACHLARAVLEQLAIGVDAIRSGCESPTAQVGIIVLSHREGRRTGSVGARDRLDTVVGAGGQVDDDPVDVG
jgi:hypothetical protein